MALKRLNMNIDEELISYLDTYSEQMHVNRSAAVSFILSQFFETKKNMQTVSSLVDVYNDAKTRSGGDLSKITEKLKEASVI